MFRHDQLRKTNGFQRTYVCLWRSLKHMDLDSPKKNGCTLLKIIFNQRTVVTEDIYRFNSPPPEVSKRHLLNNL
jgi:hypothetical protein